MYRLFEHTADLGLHVESPDLDTLFREAAEGLFAMIVEEIPQDAPAEERPFSIAGERHDYLLFDWLNELLYVFDTERLLFDRFRVKVGANGLEATALGRPLDPARQRLLHEVKAITYHRLRVDRTDRGWLAELIVDI